MASILRTPILVLLAAVVGVAIPGTPVSAAHVTTWLSAARTNARLAGQVTAVSGRASTPTAFSLQLRDRTVDIEIVPRTTFLARSAEAQIEGFGQYVFALVTATKASNGEWIASRVDYDLVPFGPIRDFTVSGRITWLDKKAQNFRLKMLSGDIHLIRLTARTKYQMDSLPIEIAPTLIVGNAVDVVVHRNLADVWVAVSVNLRLSGPGRYLR